MRTLTEAIDVPQVEFFGERYILEVFPDEPSVSHSL